MVSGAHKEDWYPSERVRKASYLSMPSRGLSTGEGTDRQIGTPMYLGNWYDMIGDSLNILWLVLVYIPGPRHHNR